MPQPENQVSIRPWHFDPLAFRSRLWLFVESRDNLHIGSCGYHIEHGRPGGGSRLLLLFGRREYLNIRVQKQRLLVESVSSWCQT